GIGRGLGPDQRVVSATTFASAARAFADLVGEIPDSAWDGPGLGDWDLRSLVGHTSRALVTVATYSQTAADHEDLPNAQAYFARIKAAASTAEPSGIVERGRQAGLELGNAPAQAVEV